MTTLDGAVAIAWMRARGTNVPGTCLNTVWQAYGSYPSTGAHAGQYPAAINGWEYATDQHHGDASPPPGVPVYFGPSPTRTDANAAAGDVAISLGGGQLIATDYPSAGRIGTLSIGQRAAQTARPYLGWTGDFLGYPVKAVGAAVFTPTTTLEGNEDMAIHVLRQANGKTFSLYKDLIIYDPAEKDQQVVNYLQHAQAPSGLSEADLLIALYRVCGISQSLAPWPTEGTTATNVLDSVLPGPSHQYTRQVFDAAGKPSLIKYN